MRSPCILDVMQAVKAVAARQPDVTAWWYMPVRRFRLDGGPGDTSDAGGGLDVFVEGPASLDLDLIARDLSARLGAAPVRVRPYRGADEGRAFRLLSRDATAKTSEQGLVDSNGGVP